MSSLSLLSWACEIRNFAKQTYAAIQKWFQLKIKAAYLKFHEIPSIHLIKLFVMQKNDFILSAFERDKNNAAFVRLALVCTKQNQPDQKVPGKGDQGTYKTRRNLKLRLDK